jgi:Ni/Co efflux regulator RcnB
MKTRWFLAAFGTALFALSLGGGAVAQERHDHHWDKDHPAFDDHERGQMRDWYREHHEHPPVGFRDRDRLERDMDGRLAAGFVLTPEYRRRIVGVPPDLYRRLPPPPRGYRYVVIGGHVCLIDRDWRVRDVVHFELDFHL